MSTQQKKFGEDSIFDGIEFDVDDDFSEDFEDDWPEGTDFSDELEEDEELDALEEDDVEDEVEDAEDAEQAEENEAEQDEEDEEDEVDLDAIDADELTAALAGDDEDDVAPRSNGSSDSGDGAMTATEENVNAALDEEGVKQKLSLEEAIDLINKAQDNIGDHQNALILLRWRQGIIADSVEVKEGEQTFQRLSKAVGPHANTLRQCKRLVQFFNHDKQKFQEWMDETGKATGKGYVRWVADVLDLLKEDTDPKVLGKEELRKKWIRRIENQVSYLEELNDKVEFAESEDFQREVEGLTMRAIEEYQRFIRTRFYQEGEYDESGATPRSDAYLDWLRDQPSAISGQKPCIPHHTVRGGTANKGSDFMAVPITQEEHEKLHGMDEERFWRKHGVDNVDQLTSAYQHLWMTGTQNGRITVPTDENSISQFRVEDKDA